jgi:hypothetical protein
VGDAILEMARFPQARRILTLHLPVGPHIEVAALVGAEGMVGSLVPISGLVGEGIITMIATAIMTHVIGCTDLAVARHLRVATGTYAIYEMIEILTGEIAMTEDLERMSRGGTILTLGVRV